MNIKLDEQFRIVSDEYQFILQKLKIRNDKSKEQEKEAYKNLSYHTSLEDLLSAYFRHRVVQSTAEDLKSLVREVRGVKQYIKDLIEQEEIE